MLIELLIVVLVAMHHSHAQHIEYVTRQYGYKFGKDGYKIGNFQIENKSEKDFIHIHYLTHLVSNDNRNGYETTIVDLRVDPGKKSHFFKFDYKTGLFAGFDYWYISVGKRYDQIRKTKTNFYCNISADDNGVVLLIVDINNKTFQVVPPNSSSCVTTLS